MKNQFFVQWHITNLCNLRCEHCYQEDFSKSRDLNWRGLKKVSDNILSAMTEWDKKACIHLTGGEPLLKKEVYSLLNHLEGQHPVEELGIITNGLFFDPDVVKRLSGLSKLRKIKISLDGAVAETHESTRGKGTFHQVLQNLSLIRKGGRFEIVLMLTVMKRNFRDLLPLLSLCRDLEVDGLIVERFIPWGRGREIRGEVLDKKEWKELVGMLLEFFSVEDDCLFPYQAFQVSFQDGETELSGAPCVIGSDGFCITPEGTFFPCRRFPVSMGDLLTDSLREIWEGSEILEKLRRKENLKGRCGRCEVTECRGCRSLALALTGDYLAEDPHCYKEFP